jgi:hypothetical protein
MTASLRDLRLEQARRTVGLMMPSPLPPPLPKVGNLTLEGRLREAIRDLSEALIRPALRQRTGQEFAEFSAASFDAFWPKLATITALAPCTDERDAAALFVAAAEVFGGARWGETMRFSLAGMRRTAKVQARLATRGLPRDDHEVLAFAKFGTALLAWNWSLFCFAEMLIDRRIARAEVRETVRGWLDESSRLSWSILRGLEIELDRAAEGAQEHAELQIEEHEADFEALLDDADAESARLLDEVEGRA